MSDTPPIIPQLYGGLTASEFTSARTAWANAGHDDAAFLAGMGGTAPPVIASAKPAGPAPAYDLTTPTLDLTQDQIARATRSLIASGASPEAVSAALAADGFLGPEAEQRSPEEVAHDAEFGAGPFSPDQFRQIDWRELPAHMQQQSIELIAEIDKDIRGWLADLKMAPALGSSFAEHVFRVAGELRAMSPADREVWKANGANEIRALYPSQEAFDEAAESVRVLLDLPGVDHPISAVLRSGHLCDVWAWRTLANHAEHLVNWAGSRPERKASK